MAGATAILLVVIGVMAYILFLFNQNLSQSSTIASQEEQLRNERDSIERTNEHLQQVLQSLQIANTEKDSTNNQLLLSYERLSEKERELLKSNAGFQTNLSRVLAEKANQLTDDGDSYLARLIALQALPLHIDHIRWRREGLCCNACL